MGRTFVQAVIPPPLDVKRMQKPIIDGLKEFGNILKFDLNGTVRTWKNKPKFAIYITPFSFGTTKVEITFDAPGEQGQIWRWTDEGTKPHIIRPKPTNKLGVLIFPSMFKPKTKPGSLRAGAGFSGGPPRIAREVHHPGTTPRRFSAEIAKRRGKAFAIIMQKAMDKVAEVAWRQQKYK